MIFGIPPCFPQQQSDPEDIDLERTTPSTRLGYNCAVHRTLRPFKKSSEIGVTGYPYLSTMLTVQISKRVASLCAQNPVIKVVMLGLVMN